MADLADKNRSPKRMYWAQMMTMRKQHIFDAGNGGIALCAKWQLLIDPDDSGAVVVVFITRGDVQDTANDCKGCWDERERLKLWRN